jgi:hypothetical protein
MVGAGAAYCNFFDYIARDLLPVLAIIAIAATEC